MLPRPSRNVLVAALAARRLDRTLTSALPAVDQYDESVLGATGVAPWDAALAGGLPRGQLSEIAGPASSGRTSLLLQLMAAATARGELVALIDALDRFDPASAEAAGVVLDRVLWIRGFVVTNPVRTRDEAPLACPERSRGALEQAIKAFTLVLQAGNFGLAALDVGDAPAEMLRRLPFTVWMRLQRLLDGQPTIGILLGSSPLARSPAGLTLSLDRGSSPARSAARFRGRLFDGLDLDLRLRRARARIGDERACSLATKAVANV